MVNLRCMQIVICLIVVDIAVSAIFSNISEVDNALDNAVDKVDKDFRRRGGGKKKMHRSTSSSSESKKGKSSGTTDRESLAISSSSSTSGSDEKGKKKHRPQSTEERHGWRKWHRKCTRCPEDMLLKWRDPRVKWICGAYQQARRSFKSLCMMHYRNCQDGTMFIKIADHRCQNDTYKQTLPHGEHFFYDYPAKLSMDSSTSGTSEETLSEESSSDF